MSTILNNWGYSLNFLLHTNKNHVIIIKDLVEQNITNKKSYPHRTKFELRSFEMAIKYTRQQIIDTLEQSKGDMGAFYQKDFINYSGYTIDTNELYTEVISEWLTANFTLLESIPFITRKNSYNTQTHHGLTERLTSNRLEERIAMAMYRQKGLPCLGLVMDYQTPLKDKSTSIAGKIDLLTYDGKVLRVMELKEPDSKETMLRCVLEGFTYMKTAKIDKLIGDFQLPHDTKVQACPFVVFDGVQHKEMSGQKPHLHHLMKMLDCEPFFYEKTGDYYIVKQ